MRTRVLALVSLAILTGTGVLSAPAQAAEAAPEARLMSRSDLQEFGGVRKPVKLHWSVTARTTDLPNVLCLNAAGSAVTFPDAAGWSADGEVNSKKYAEVTEFVRDYGSADAANAAWASLVSATSACARSTREALTSGNPTEYYQVSQSASTSTDAVTTFERSVAVSSDERINGSTTVTYSSYRRSGSAIIQVMYYQNPGKKVDVGLRKKITDLTVELVDRWAT